MILIDAIYINNGGGKVLLDYLIEELEKTNKQIFYLLDSRIQGNIPNIKSKNKVRFINSSFIKRYWFYKKNKNKFSSVLCFGNLPPNLRVEVDVYTYFHQPMFLNIPKDFRFFERLKLILKTKILNLIKDNTNYWMVQNKFIRQKLAKKYNLSKDNILILPFYKPMLTLKEEIRRDRNSFIYVSNATPNKNHIRLIDGFCRFYDKYKKGKLILTVSEKFTTIKSVIDEKIRKGYPIHNVGFVSREELAELFYATEFLIFPSLAESFGLGIVEAIETNCKVIGADLPYMYEVCEPSLVFNPFSVDSIYQAFVDSTNDVRIKQSTSLVKNNIHTIIQNLE